MNYIIIGSGRDSFAEAVRLSHAAGLMWSSCIDKAGDWCICMDDDAPRDAVEGIASATAADLFEEGASLAADREITEAASRVIEAHQRYCEALVDLLIWANE